MFDRREQIPRRDFPKRILYKIVFSSLIPLICITLLLGLISYRVARFSLDQEMGKRLMGLAYLTAHELDPQLLSALLPGDESTPLHQKLITQIKQVKGLEAISAITVFDPRNRILADTEGNPIGTEYLRALLDRVEIEQASGGKPSTSITFKGSDGQLYKSGYAPVLYQGRLIALVGVEGSVGFYKNLYQLRRWFIAAAILGIIIAVILSVFTTGRLVRPIYHLVSAAREIGSGNMLDPVVPLTKDELGYLAASVNEMRENIVKRDLRLQMMLRGIAHEIKNPLGGMKLFIDHLRDGIQGDEKLLRLANKIDSEIDTLSRLVTEFVEYSRESGLDKKEANLVDLINEVLGLIAPKILEKHIEITKELPENMHFAFDWERFRRALINILENGIRAVPEAGHILIKGSHIDGNWFISIADNGVGIPPEIQEKVFEPFFSTREKGTGLGLAFVKKIVEEHHGQVRLSSTPGQGTVIEISLPEK